MCDDSRCILLNFQFCEYDCKPTRIVKVQHLVGTLVSPDCKWRKLIFKSSKTDCFSTILLVAKYYEPGLVEMWHELRRPLAHTQQI